MVKMTIEDMEMADIVMQGAKRSKKFKKNEKKC